MPDFLTVPLGDQATTEPLWLLLRLTLAAVAGGAVALVYRKTRTAEEVSPSFPPTLVLLAILIAMVTQVIGDNVARAFSLVGALSIVRFRTVVRDTQDTAFVIFAVVVGMAVGANDPWVVVIGITVVAIAALLMKKRPTRAGAAAPEASTVFLLSIRVALANDLEGLAGSVVDAHVEERRLVEMSTAKQGIAVSASYTVRFRPSSTPEQLLKALNRVEGVQDVEIHARPSEDNS